MQPKKFIKRAEKEIKPTPIKVNKQKAFRVTLTGLVISGVLFYIGFTSFLLTQKIANSWSAIKFAYSYPELVEPLQKQYVTEHSALKDSLVKRQALISPLTESTESAEVKKELGQ